MWIKSCNIKAFGNIRNKEFTFDKGVNCFVRENGNGKTTLADFIRVMLYGMKTAKASSMGDRRRYLPFGEERLFGGSMTVMVGNEETVISRTFDSKTVTKDTLKINGIDASEDDQTIGEKLFNIDEDAFKRTVYITSFMDDNEAVCATDSITRNMDMMVSDIDTVDLKAVLNSFEQRCNDIQTSNRTTKNMGEINRLDNTAEELNNSLIELRAIDENLTTKYSALNRLNEEQNAVYGKLDTARRKTHELALWKQIDDHKARIDQGKEALNVLMQRYPKGMITYADIKVIADANISIGNVEAALSVSKESDESKSAFEVLEKRYSTDFDPNEYEAVKALKRESDEEKIRIEAEAATRLQGEELASLFAVATPSAEEMENNRSKALKYKDNEVALQGLATISTQHKLPVATLIACISGIFTGIVILALGKMEVGIAIALLSVIGLVLTLFISRQKENQSAQSRAVELKEENSKLESELRRFYARWGFYDTAFLEYADSLKDKVSEYESYLEAKAKRDNSLKTRKLDIEKNRVDIEKYLERYGVKDLSAVESDYKRYMEQKEQRRVAQEKRVELERIKSDNTSALMAVFEKYGLEVPENVANKIEGFRSDLSVWETLNSTITELEKHIQKLKDDNGLTVRPAAIIEGEDEGSLQNKYDAIVKEIVRLSDDITSDEDRVKQIDEKEAKLNEIAERKELLKSRLSILQKTKAYIVSADRTLKDKFVGPVKNQYGKYMHDLLPRWADDIEMDTDYRVKVKYDNVAHESYHLSQGERRCLEMALRIAVIDNMYKGEKPFLVMDDPFVELDSANLVKAKELISKISKQYQVVYFSCHESRGIN